MAIEFMQNQLRGKWSLLAGWAFASVVGVFILPYFLPVSPTIGLSYLAGFNNKASLIAFVVSGAALSLLLGTPRRNTSDSSDEALGSMSLVLTLLGTLTLCLVWLAKHRGHMWGGEVAYSMDRLFHLNRGEVIYRDYEYAYGPLMLYAPWLLHRLFHLTLPTSYFVCWTVEYCVGAGMLWYVVARLPRPLNSRLSLFLLLYGVQLMYLAPQGVTTGLRVNGAAALAVWFYGVTEGDWPLPLKCGAFVAVIGLGFAISPEQGIALIAGLCAYDAFMAMRRGNVLRWMQVGVEIVLGLGGCALLNRWKMFQTTTAFSLGGYSFPALPHPGLVLVLAICLSAMVLARRAWVEETSQAGVMIPLVLCGIPLIGSVLGRCDVMHLISITPMLAVGLIPIFTRRWVATYLWIPIVCYTLLWKLPHGGTPRLDDTETMSERYYVPLVSQQRCYSGEDICDTGYFFGMVNVMTPDDLRRKEAEIRKAASRTMLLGEGKAPVAIPVWASNVDLGSLRQLEPFPVRLKQRHEVLKMDRLAQAITSQSQPSKETFGELHVWVPRKP